MKKSTRTITEAGLGTPIAIGRSAEIFSWDEGRVLKLFFKNIPAADIRTEFENTREANAGGMTRPFSAVRTDTYRIQ